MKVFLVLGIICLIVVILAWVIYAVNTRIIIRDQEKEIEELHRALNKEKKTYKEPVYVEIEKDGRVPTFGGF